MTSISTPFFHTLLPFLGWIILCSCTSVKQTTDGSSSTEVETDYVTQEKEFHDIRTIQLYPEGSPLAPPYLDLIGQQQLTLHFDDLSAGFENYQYRLVHCDHNWEPSDLPSNNYIRGFQSLTIEDMESSFGTMQSYTHYRVNFPNDMQEILLSGNYLCEVSLLDTPDDVIFSKRFIVFEQLVRFEPRVKEATIISERRYNQEIDFNIAMNGYPMPRPYQDLHVHILQNHRWDNAILNLPPVFVKTDEIEFNHDEENNFRGLNEYRFLDLKDLRINTINMDSIRQTDVSWEAWLKPDIKRSFQTYSTLQDINGRYLIKNDLFDDKVESEYVMSHFRLALDYPLNAPVCVVGDGFGYTCNENNLLVFDPLRKEYRGSFYLKQGYYNFLYGIEYNQGTTDIRELEGSHRETGNEYTVIAYYYDPVGYDRVIGMLFTDQLGR
ncbi:MAG: DUF5103 domain-containing protein [Flavobacteriales bacterium]|nr:DUF5103 domain-containing protein [Flavobacteriales bacterium]